MKRPLEKVSNDQAARDLLMKVRRFCVQFSANDSGQGLVEYALIVALVSIMAIAALQLLGKKASNTLSNAASYLK